MSISRPIGNQPLILADVNNSSVSWDGIAHWYGGAITTSGIAYINYYYTKGYTAAKAQGVAAHEIGHELGLAHRDGCYLMNPNTPNRCGISVPTSDEVNGVNALY